MQKLFIPSGTHEVQDYNLKVIGNFADEEYHSNSNNEFVYADLTQVCLYDYTSLQPQ